MRFFFLVVTRHPASLAGAAITTAAAFLILTLFGLELAGVEGGPYIGILTYLVLPCFFLLGLALVPLGTALHARRKRRAARRGEPLGPPLPIIDLNKERTRRLALTFSGLTLANLVILSVATYKGVEVMDSTEFCGATCHQVMQPEYTAYQRSPHARVGCVSCHIGPGAGWFVKSKLSGSYQVISVAFGLYPRPIPTPVHNLRPARETCEQCHWPAKFVGDRLKVLTRFRDDEANTPTQTVLLVKVGGLRGRTAQGIHWHVDPAIELRYRADEKREIVHEVELKLPDGTVKSFRRPGGAENSGPDRGEGWRVMDCVDCHNRPTHVFRTPQREVDLALEDGRLDRSLPYIRREAVRALEGSYPSHEAARRAIRERIETFYADTYPQIVASKREAIETAAKVLGDLYCANVFPAMNVQWGTYPNHIGHQDSPGCFRCHDEELTTILGEAISQDCSLCHSLLAVEEESPEILPRLQP